MRNATTIRCRDGIERSGKLFTTVRNGEAVIIHTTPDGGKMFLQGPIIVAADDDALAAEQAAEMAAEQAAADALYGFTY